MWLEPRKKESVIAEQIFLWHLSPTPLHWKIEGGLNTYPAKPSQERVLADVSVEKGQTCFNTTDTSVSLRKYSHCLLTSEFKVLGTIQNCLKIPSPVRTGLLECNSFRKATYTDGPITYTLVLHTRPSKCFFWNIFERPLAQIRYTNKIC